MLLFEHFQLIVEFVRELTLRDVGLLAQRRRWLYLILIRAALLLLQTWSINILNNKFNVLPTRLGRLLAIAVIDVQSHLTQCHICVVGESKLIFEVQIEALGIHILKNWIVAEFVVVHFYLVVR